MSAHSETQRQARERRAQGILKLKFKQQASLEAVLAGRAGDIPVHRKARLRDQGLITYTATGEEVLTERGQRSLAAAQGKATDAP